MTHFKALVAFAELPLLFLVVLAQAVVPNVVLGQADVNVKRDVVLGAREKGPDYCSCPGKTCLVVRVCYGVSVSMVAFESVQLTKQWHDWLIQPQELSLQPRNSYEAVADLLPA